MSERGALRIVVEGADAHRIHDRLMGFVTQSESNPETRVEDPEGELYWVVSDDGAEDNISIDCYSFDGRFQGCTTIYWDAYRNEGGIVRIDVQWLNSLAFLALCCILIDDERNLYYEYSSVNWGKDWDNLSFEERIALCDGFGVIYIATQVK